MLGDLLSMKREYAFDILKFVAMLMIVRGHLEGNGFFSVSEGVITNISIGIAMPLFFISSGYFSVSVINRKFVFARVISFLWPLASFGVVFSIVLLLFDKISVGKAVVYPLIRVYCGSWFLTTLSIILILNAVVWRFSEKRAVRLFVLFSIYVLCFFLAESGRLSKFFHISNVLDMLPYFCFGLFFLRQYNWHNNLIVGAFCGFIFLIIVFNEGNVRTNGMGFYWVTKDWRMVIQDSNLLLCFFMRTIVGITGTIFALNCLQLFLKFVPKSKKLSYFGNTTLGVYVIHEWPLIQLKKKLSIGPFEDEYRWVCTLVLFFCCHFFVVFIKSIPWLNSFFFGSENVVNSMYNRTLSCINKK